MKSVLFPITKSNQMYEHFFLHDRVQCLSEMAKLKHPAGATSGQMAAMAAANKTKMSAAKSQEDLDQETEKLLNVRPHLHYEIIAQTSHK